MHKLHVYTAQTKTYPLLLSNLEMDQIQFVGDV